VTVFSPRRGRRSKAQGERTREPWGGARRVVGRAPRWAGMVPGAPPGFAGTLTLGFTTTPFQGYDRLPLCPHYQNPRTLTAKSPKVFLDPPPPVGQTVRR